MARSRLQSAARAAAAWTLAERQHGVIARRQLLELGFTVAAIDHRIATGRLHPVRRGIYAVGRPQLTREGEWMAAVLACGPGAMLSHEHGGALMGIVADPAGPVHVSVGLDRHPHPGRIVVHRRSARIMAERTDHHEVPVTSAVVVLLDVALRLDRGALERAINDADKRDLTDPERLRAELEGWRGHPGVRRLRSVLDRAMFSLTESELERLFLPIASSAGLPTPRAQVWLNGFRVDFFWPDLGLVVETDGLRYHRTPQQQARDTVRDHAHLAAGLTPLRFTHGQIKFDPGYVRSRLATVARMLVDRSHTTGALTLPGPG